MTRLRSRLGRWARGCERPLPWRGERDPYRVLVSEVMLQQTQAGRVAEAYPAFLERFPTVEALAGASAADVLRAWGSLGYNRRAVHLWRAARACVGSGGVPGSVAELEALPGVGPYTARAVAAFAFGADEAAVDANVRRVLTRAFGLPPDADVQDLADEVLPRGRAGEWNQALMDLGALVCRPKGARCEACPLRGDCAWAAGERPERRPRSDGTVVPFPETRRYARGRVVAALRGARGGATVRGIARASGLAEGRVRDALRGLERDGVVSTRRGRVRLGPSEPGRAAPRRR